MLNTSNVACELVVSDGSASGELARALAHILRVFFVLEYFSTVLDRSSRLISFKSRAKLSNFVAEKTPMLCMYSRTTIGCLSLYCGGSLQM
ncbi:hypothetical protein GBAR_LOCUS19887 [Geodia barretti]|uniref:Uncharacterized protein n=1 Tax=Geodia barretti TaxID=519541 RepID=A0AA35SUY9_GEOBA|nr:hypothetical protein GBAR_LOCUS19887 [Geodia barretti]